MHTRVHVVCSGLLLSALGVVAASSSASAQTAANPLAPTAGYLVVVESDARLGAGDIQGTVAMGGRVQIGGQFTIATRTDNPPAPGDSLPTALYVAGSVDFAGSDVGGRLNVNQGLAKVADASNATIAGGAPAGTMQIVPAGGGSQTTPQVNVNGTQSPASVSTPPSPSIDVAAAFMAMRASSSSLGLCAVGGVRLTDANGTTTFDPADIPPGAQVYVHLTVGRTNVLNLTVANLLRVGSFTFRDAPSASTPLVINVDLSGSPTLDWSVPNQAGASSATAPFTLWNFVGTSTITMTGGGALEGTFLGADVTLVDHSSSNIQGNVVAHSYQHGSAQSSGGAVTFFPFQSVLTGCAPPPTTTTTTTTLPPPRLGSFEILKSIIGDGAGQQGPIEIAITCTPPNGSIPPFRIPAGATGVISTIVTGITVPAGCQVRETETGSSEGIVVQVRSLTAVPLPVCPIDQANGAIPVVRLENVVEATTLPGPTVTTTSTTAPPPTSAPTTTPTTTTVAPTTTSEAPTTTPTTEPAPTTPTTAPSPTTGAPSTSVSPSTTGASTTSGPVPTTPGPITTPPCPPPTLPPTGTSGAPTTTALGMSLGLVGIGLLIVATRRRPAHR